MSDPTRPHLAVDLTPMLPDAENGGAKILILELLKQFRGVAQEWDFTLLTPESCNQQLAYLDAENMRRLCIQRSRPTVATGAGTHLRRLARGLASRIPPPLAARMIDLYWALTHRPATSTVVDEIGAHLLFNPFTAPLYRSARVPAVAIVYDLQFVSYPQFFSADERYGRAAHLRAAAEAAAKLICISEYVRRSVLAELAVSSTQVVTVPIQLARRLPDVAADKASAVLARHSLTAERYLLYPANFWPHKNHRMLLVAFRQFVERHPSTDLQLVCTGQPGQAMGELVEVARRMGLGPRCRFPGFVADEELAALLSGCRALIFPSLYEGFGMPLLEAMEGQRPILGSNRTALPEVGGEAVLWFDPRKPEEIVAAIERIDGEAELRTQLVKRGRMRRGSFADPRAMANAYLRIFADVMRVDAPGNTARADSAEQA